MSLVRLVKNDRNFGLSIDRDFFNYAFEFITFPDIESLDNGFRKRYLVSDIFFSILLGNSGLNLDTRQFFHQEIIYGNRYKNTPKIFDNEIESEKYIRNSAQKYISKEV